MITKNEMLGMMGGDKKLLEKYIPKEPKQKNKVGCFVVKVRGGYFLQDVSKTIRQIVDNKKDAYKFENYDLAKDIAKKYNGKVVRYWICKYIVVRKDENGKQD